MKTLQNSKATVDNLTFSKCCFRHRVLGEIRMVMFPAPPPSPPRKAVVGGNQPVRFARE